jgi:hypothetical protein
MTGYDALRCGEEIFKGMVRLVVEVFITTSIVKANPTMDL